MAPGRTSRHYLDTLPVLLVIEHPEREAALHYSSARRPYSAKTVVLTPGWFRQAWVNYYSGGVL